MNPRERDEKHARDARVGHVQEIAVRVSLKNNRLREARRARALTVAALCQAAGVGVREYYLLEGIRRSARRPDGTLRPPAARLCTYLQIDPLTVFPLVLDAMQGEAREFPADVSELHLVAAQLQAGGWLGGWQPLDPETALAMKEECALALHHVSQVQATVLLRRVEETLDVVGEELEVSRERVRQVEAAARRRARKCIEAARGRKRVETTVTGVTVRLEPLDRRTGT